MRGRERRLVLATAVCLGMMLPVQADYEAGVTAYYRQDYETALREFKTDAAAGDENAQYNVGLMYLKGQGVPQNPEEAARWFHRAAIKGRWTRKASSALSTPTVTECTKITHSPPIG